MVNIRKLKEEDLNNGFLKCLEELSNDICSLDQAKDILRERNNKDNLTFVALSEGKVVGTASLIIESKFLHGKRVGHVEDVAVLSEFQGKKIGHQLIDALVLEAKANNCYKMILDCKKELIPFYQRFGFEVWEGSMRMNLS